MHFQNANSSTEIFPAALPKKLASSNINLLQKNDKFTSQKKTMGKE